MNKKTTFIASSLVALGLLSGSTLALWSDDTSTSQSTITAGRLGMTITPREWFDISPVTGPVTSSTPALSTIADVESGRPIDINTFKTAPGDVIASVQKVELDLVGDNLAVDVTIPLSASGLLADGSPVTPTQRPGSTTAGVILKKDIYSSDGTLLQTTDLADSKPLTFVSPEYKAMIDNIGQSEEYTAVDETNPDLYVVIRSSFDSGTPYDVRQQAQTIIAQSAVEVKQIRKQVSKNVFRYGNPQYFNSIQSPAISYSSAIIDAPLTLKSDFNIAGDITGTGSISGAAYSITAGGDINLSGGVTAKNVNAKSVTASALNIKSGVSNIEEGTINVRNQTANRSYIALSIPAAATLNVTGSEGFTANSGTVNVIGTLNADVVHMDQSGDIHTGPLASSNFDNGHIGHLIITDARPGGELVATSKTKQVIDEITFNSSPRVRSMNDVGVTGKVGIINAYNDILLDNAYAANVKASSYKVTTNGLTYIGEGRIGDLIIDGPTLLDYNPTVTGTVTGTAEAYVSSTPFYGYANAFAFGSTQYIANTPAILAEFE